MRVDRVARRGVRRRVLRSIRERSIRERSIGERGTGERGTGECGIWERGVRVWPGLRVTGVGRGRDRRTRWRRAGVRRAGIRRTAPVRRVRVPGLAHRSSLADGMPTLNSGSAPCGPTRRRAVRTDVLVSGRLRNRSGTGCRTSSPDRGAAGSGSSEWRRTPPRPRRSPWPRRPALRPRWPGRGDPGPVCSRPDPAG